MARVFKMSDEAFDFGYDWDLAIFYGCIETVKEFSTKEEAIAYFENELGGDSDYYGVD